MLACDERVDGWMDGYAPGAWLVDYLTPHDEQGWGLRLNMYTQQEAKRSKGL